MADIPESFTFQLIESSSRKPIENLAVLLILFAKRKNDYSVGPKMTDTEGRVTFSKKECLNEIEASQKLFIMDYSSSLEECLPKIAVKIPSIGQIKKIIELWTKHRDVFSKYYDYDGAFLRQLSKVSNINFKSLMVEFFQTDLYKKNLVPVPKLAFCTFF